MMKLIRACLALLLLGTPLHAQSIGQLGAGQLLGNSTASQKNASPTTVTAIVDRALTGATTQGAVLTRNATVWVGLAPGTAGLPLLSGGAAANLAYGILGLSGGGTNANLTASNGGLFYSTATAGAILSGTASANRPVLSGSSAAPSWAAISYPTSANSGGIPYFSSSTAISSSATLTANQVMVGGGAGGSPTTFACATATTVVHGGAPPTCSQIVAGDVTTNTLSNSNLAQVGAVTLKGNPTNATANATDFTINGLTNRGTPDGANDRMLIWDAAAGTLKYVTPSNITTVAGVSSIAGNTGAFTLTGGITNATNAIRLASIADRTALANVTGSAAAPTAVGFRELLVANRSYYVRTDGNDSFCTGLTNAAYVSGAFPQDCAWLTLQQAANWIQQYVDLGGYVATVNVAAGAYTSGVLMFAPFVGGAPSSPGGVIFSGDVTTPSNVTITGTGNVFLSSFGAKYTLRGFKLANSSSGADLIYASAGGGVFITAKMDYGATGAGLGANLHANFGGWIVEDGDYTISGNANNHLYASGGGKIEMTTGTVTISGTPTINYWGFAYNLGFITTSSQTYSGSPAGGGTKYLADRNGTILLNGLTWPGTNAGSATNGGQAS